MDRNICGLSANLRPILLIGIVAACIALVIGAPIVPDDTGVCLKTVMGKGQQISITKKSKCRSADVRTKASFILISKLQTQLSDDELKAKILTVVNGMVSPQPSPTPRPSTLSIPFNCNTKSAYAEAKESDTSLALDVRCPDGTYATQHWSKVNPFNMATVSGEAPILISTKDLFSLPQNTALDGDFPVGVSVTALVTGVGIDAPVRLSAGIMCCPTS